MRVQCGMNANLSLVGLEPCVINLKEKQSRDADTNNKEERDKNKQTQLWFSPQRHWSMYS